ncbi:hypothetical protein [Mesorhizobium sp. M1A.T.Ca.IN.004.03.1.1]|nr:hypothetical protein [Mesorhizobium sp. M1A.T.Ca.IN.004.03.1.1]
MKLLKLLECIWPAINATVSGLPQIESLRVSTGSSPVKRRTGPLSAPSC